METTRTMRVTSVREIPVMSGAPTDVEMMLAEDSASMPAMEQARVTVAIADQMPVGTRYTVVTTYTEIPA